MSFIDVAKYIYKVYLKKSIISVKKGRKIFEYMGDNVLINTPIKIGNLPNKISIGSNTTILNDSRLNVFSENNGNACSIIIGESCYICYHFSALAVKNIVIGNNVLIASNVLITSEKHGINPEDEIEYMDQPLSGEEVYIGDGCWIGEKVIILPGVVVGKKSIIGAGSVVTKSIPAYSIAVGNPARVIKQYNFEKHCWEKV